MTSQPMSADRPVDPGPIGLWTGFLDRLPTSELQERVAEIDERGWGALWLPEAVGREPFVSSALALGASSRLVVATGIASIYARDAMTMAAGHRTLTEAFPNRFLLGMGVSHQPMVEGLRGHDYSRPLATMRAYLDAMDGALYFGAPPPHEPQRVLAALGPEDDRARRRAGDGRPSLLRAGRAHADRPRRARRRTAARASSRRWCSRPTRPRPARSRGPTWRSTPRSRTTPTTSAATGSATTTSPTAAATASSTRSWPGATSTPPSIGSAPISTPEPTTSACRSSRPTTHRASSSGAGWPTRSCS